MSFGNGLQLQLVAWSTYTRTNSYRTGSSNYSKCHHQIVNLLMLLVLATYGNKTSVKSSATIPIVASMLLWMIYIKRRTSTHGY